MNDQIKGRKIRRVLIYSATGVVVTAAVIGVLYGLRPLLLPFILGALLAYLFKPLVRSFKGPKWKAYLRACVLLFVVGGGIYGLARLVKQSLPSEKEKLELQVRLQYRFNERYRSWLGLNDDGQGNFIYRSLGDELDPIRRKIIDYVALTPEQREHFLLYRQGHKGEEPISDKYYEFYLANLKARKIDIQKLEASKALSSPRAESEAAAAGQHTGDKKSTLNSLIKTFTNWIIMPLVFIFLLMDKGQIIHFFMRLVPNRYFELTHTVLEHVDTALGKYIRGTIMECMLVGITLAIGFYLCGLEFKIAFIIGAIGGLTNAIPFVGTFIACAIGAVYSLIAENIDPIIPFVNENNLMIAVIGVVMVAHLLDNAIYQPLVVGGAVNIHPLVVIMGVFGGSLMFGFAGLLLAIPTIVIVKVVTETFFTGLKDYRII